MLMIIEEAEVAVVDHAMKRWTNDTAKSHVIL
jgi:hypothetical protein